MAQQPRKFVEKMALLKEKERQQSMAVEQVLQEVRAAKVGVGGGRRMGSSAAGLPYADYASAAQPPYYASPQTYDPGYGPVTATPGPEFQQQQQLINSRLTQSLPVLYSPPPPPPPPPPPSMPAQQQLHHNVFDLQSALHEQRELVSGGVPPTAASLNARGARFKVPGADFRPELTFQAPQAPLQTLDVPEQMYRRIKSEPNIVNSVKATEDSSQLRRRLLTATTTIPEDDRTGSIKIPSSFPRQRTQSTVLPPSYMTSDDGYSLAGARASSVPDLTENPITSSGDYDDPAMYAAGHMSGAASAAAAGGQTGYFRVKQHSLMNKQKSPSVPRLARRLHQQQHLYSDVDTVSSPSIHPPPMYSFNEQQPQQPDNYSDFPQLVSPPLSVNSNTSSLSRQQQKQQFGFSMSHMSDTQPQQRQQQQQQQQQYFCDVGTDMQQTVALQQKFNAMNVASSTANNLQTHQLRHVQNSPSFPVATTTTTLAAGYSGNDQLGQSPYSPYFSQSSSVPSLVVTPNNDHIQQQQQHQSYSTSGQSHTLNISTSETLVDSLFAKQLDNSELETLLYSENMLPDPETEEALKRQP